MNRCKKVWRKMIGIVGISSLILASGCGSNANTKSTSKEADVAMAASYDAAPKMSYETEGAEAGGLQDATMSLNGKGENPSVNTASNYNRKVIKTGQLELQTETFGQTIDGLTNYVISLGGYVESSNIQGSSFYNRENTNRTASLTVKIPQKQFDQFINKGSEFGYVAYLTCNSEDITSAYVDTEIRLKTLKIRHERLLALLEQSGKLSELFEIEQEIGNVTYEIESLSGTLNHYDALVDMGTITIQIQEVKKLEVEAPKEEGLGVEMAEAFKASLKTLLSIGKGIVIWLTGVIPFAVILVPIGIVVFGFLKKRTKKQVKEVEKTEEKNE